LLRLAGVFGGFFDSVMRDRVDEATIDERTMIG
jgi:hypothetical protein